MERWTAGDVCLTSSGPLFLFTIDADWIPGSEIGLDGLLQLCDELQVKATIFATGGFGRAYAHTLNAAGTAGHEIGVHGWEHPMPAVRVENYRFTPPELRRAWLEKATEMVAQVVGRRPLAFRAPFLWTDRFTFRILEGLGYTIDSSIPARRFDGLMGMVNHLEFFWASLDPYHPDPDHPGRRGSSPLLEVPPSAYVLPINMSTLRMVGLRGSLGLVRFISRRASVLNFYCHPWEFVPAARLTFPPGVPARHRTALGPQWLSTLKAFLHSVMSLGYRPCTVSEVASCGSW